LSADILAFSSAGSQINLVRDLPASHWVQVTGYRLQVFNTCLVKSFNTSHLIYQKLEVNFSQTEHKIFHVSFFQLRLPGFSLYEDIAGHKD